MDNNFNPDKCVAMARSLIGVKYTHQGRSKERGVDCAGLIIVSLQAGGWKPVKPDETLSMNYTPQSSHRKIIAALRDEGYEIPFSKIIVGDLIVMKRDGDNASQHFLLVSVVQDGHIYVLHTYQNMGRVREHRFANHLRDRVSCAWRFHGRVVNDPLSPAEQ